MRRDYDTASHVTHDVACYTTQRYKRSLRVTMGLYSNLHHGLYCGLITAVLLGSVIGSISCSSDSTGPKRSVLTPAQAYWQLQLNQHAVTMALTAPVNSIQLVATPVNANGALLSGLGRVSYTPADSVVRVDSTGLVTAQFTTQPSTKTFVIARLTDPSQHVTLVDTCFIRVTETATSRMASFSIQPADGDSAKRAYVDQSGFPLSYTVQPVAKDEGGATFTDFFSYFYSSNITVATIDKNTGAVTGHAIDHVTFYAQTWSYGVTKLDSLRFEVTSPLSQRILLQVLIPTGSTKHVLRFSPSAATVGVGANVRWDNNSINDTIDVVFDDPTNVDSAYRLNFNPNAPGFSPGFSTGSGNILPWAYDTLGTGSDPVANKINEWFRDHYLLGPVEGCPSGGQWCGRRVRRFSVAGVYHYHSTKQPTGGTIYVQ